VKERTLPLRDSNHDSNAGLSDENGITTYQRMQCAVEDEKSSVEREEEGVGKAGARKYGERDWEKGQPLSRYLDSAMRHLAQWNGGDRTEDHLAACCWNCFSYIQTEQWIQEDKLPPELDDIPRRKEVGH